MRYRSTDAWMRVAEGDVCIGQPFALHEVRPLPDTDMLMVHICIRRELFFRYFLPMFTSDSNLFHILMDTAEPGYEKQFLIHTDQCHITRSLIDVILVEYSLYRESNQTVLRPLILSLIMNASRFCEMKEASSATSDLAQHIVQYISEHSATVTLNELSERFAYNPNYISTLLPRETGKSFSKLVFEQRMQRAVSLLKSTQMSVSEIAADLGYSNSSNFYKDFRAYCSMSPRKYKEQNTTK